MFRVCTINETCMYNTHAQHNTWLYGAMQAIIYVITKYPLSSNIKFSHVVYSLPSHNLAQMKAWYATQSRQQVLTSTCKSV